MKIPEVSKSYVEARCFNCYSTGAEGYYHCELRVPLDYVPNDNSPYPRRLPTPESGATCPHGRVYGEPCIGVRLTPPAGFHLPDKPVNHYTPLGN